MARSASILTMLYQVVSRFAPAVDPLVTVEFLADVAAFLGPHGHTPYHPCPSSWTRSRLTLEWPWKDNDTPYDPYPSHVLVHFGCLPHAPLTAALVWRWQRSPRRFTRVAIATPGHWHPDSPIAYHSVRLPARYPTLDDALSYLETLGVVPDPWHGGCAIVPDH